MCIQFKQFDLKRFLYCFTIISLLSQIHAYKMEGKLLVDVVILLAHIYISLSVAYKNKPLKKRTHAINVKTFFIHFSISNFLCLLYFYNHTGQFTTEWIMVVILFFISLGIAYTGSASHKNKTV